MRHTAATKRKISEMRSGEKNPFFGKTHTKATRLRIAARIHTDNPRRTFDLAPQSIVIPVGADVPYFAAMVDGEGSISFIKKVRPFVAIYNTSVPLMRWLTATTGKRYRSDGSRRGRKVCYYWRVDAINDVHALCRALLPHLIIKRKSAERVLNFIEEKYGQTDRH